MHVFIVGDNMVSTSHTRACPEGITRQTVLDLCAAHGIAHEVRDITTTEVYTADELFCTGTMGELAAITTVDGRTIGNGIVGPMTQRLSELYAEETATTGHEIFGQLG